MIQEKLAQIMTPCILRQHALCQMWAAKKESPHSQWVKFYFCPCYVHLLCLAHLLSTEFSQTMHLQSGIRTAPSNVDPCQMLSHYFKTAFSDLGVKHEALAKPHISVAKNTMNCTSVTVGIGFSSPSMCNSEWVHGAHVHTCVVNVHQG